MSIYKFTTDQFGISESGIHLLRSGYNYKTIVFSEMESISIGRGKQISNWVVALAFGMLLVFVGLYVWIHAFHAYFFRDDVHVFYVEQFAFPVIPLIIGSYAIFVSLKNGATLRVTVNSKTMSFPVEKLRKWGQIDELITFFHNQELTKSKFMQVYKS
jgi:hypothetical protein